MTLSGKINTIIMKIAACRYRNEETYIIRFINFFAALSSLKGEK